MHHKQIAFVVGLASTLFCSRANSQGNCSPTWQPEIGAEGFEFGTGISFAFYDDGYGPKAHVLGSIANLDSHGEFEVSGIAQWNGLHWVPPAGGLLDGYAYGAQAFNDGSGSSLYVAGDFTHAGSATCNDVMRWDGQQWHAVGIGTDGFQDVAGCLAVYGPGKAQSLYIGGAFDTMSGHACVGIARWDGTTWLPVGGGFGGSFPWPLAMITFDEDGPGPMPTCLYAGGQFTAAGGSSRRYVARWNGTSWSSMSSGFNQAVQAFAVYDPDGNGPQPASLYAAGNFQSTSGGAPLNYVARWNGTQWVSVGGGVTGLGDASAYSLAVYDDGSGEKLYVGGRFTHAGGVPVLGDGFARWDGTSWSVAPWMNVDEIIFGMAASEAHPPYLGKGLWLAGRFRHAGGFPANLVAFYGCAPCRVDVDGDGFVTGADFDRFVLAFEAGETLSDDDGDGFVTGVDFDLYVQGFEAGC